MVGAADPTTGQGIVAFVILRADGEQAAAEAGGEDVARQLRAHVSKEIGPIARPRQILVVAELPKTRSGKIMRRLLQDIAENRALGDVTTLTDSTVMDAIRDRLKQVLGRNKPDPRIEEQRKLEEEREKQRQLELERQRARDRDLGWEL